MKIAILLATYMGERYIGEQIESVIKQTYQDWMIYVHDDGSTDKTMDIVQSYVERYPNKIQILEGPALGGARNNFMYLLSQVEASYYMCCDQDDIWLPEKIEKTYNAMKQLEAENEVKVPCMIYTDLTVVDGNLNIIADSMSMYQNLNCANVSIGRLLMQNVVTGCTMMLNKELRDMVIQYKNIDNIIMHDWWAAIIAALFGRLIYLNDPMIWYRQHGSNSVGAIDTHSFSYAIRKLFQTSGNKQAVQATWTQAQELVDTFSLAPESVPAILASAKKLPKWQRIRLYRKNNLNKVGFARNLGLIIWG